MQVDGAGDSDTAAASPRAAAVEGVLRGVGPAGGAAAAPAAAPGQALSQAGGPASPLPPATAEGAAVSSAGKAAPLAAKAEHTGSHDPSAPKQEVSAAPASIEARLSEAGDGLRSQLPAHQLESQAQQQLSKPEAPLPVAGWLDSLRSGSAGRAPAAAISAAEAAQLAPPPPAAPLPAPAPESLPLPAPLPAPPRAAGLSAATAMVAGVAPAPSAHPAASQELPAGVKPATGAAVSAALPPQLPLPSVPSAHAPAANPAAPAATSAAALLAPAPVQQLAAASSSGPATLPLPLSPPSLPGASAGPAGGDESSPAFVLPPPPAVAPRVVVPGSSMHKKAVEGIEIMPVRKKATPVTTRPRPKPPAGSKQPAEPAAAAAAATASPTSSPPAAPGSHLPPPLAVATSPPGSGHCSDAEAQKPNPPHSSSDAAPAADVCLAGSPASQPARPAPMVVAREADVSEAPLQPPTAAKAATPAAAPNASSVLPSAHVNQSPADSRGTLPAKPHAHRAAADRASQLQLQLLQPKLEEEAAPDDSTFADGARAARTPAAVVSAAERSAAAEGTSERAGLHAAGQTLQQLKVEAANAAVAEADELVWQVRHQNCDMISSVDMILATDLTSQSANILRMRVPSESPCRFVFWFYCVDVALFPIMCHPCHL